MYIVLWYCFLLIALSIIFFRKWNKRTFLINDRKTWVRELLFSNVWTFLGAGSLTMFISGWFETWFSLFIFFVLGYSIWMFVLLKMIPWIRNEWVKNNYYSMISFFNKEKNPILVKFLWIAQLISILIWIWVQISVFSLVFNFFFDVGFGLSVAIWSWVIILYNFFGGIKFNFISDFFQSILILLFISLLLISIIQDPSSWTISLSMPQLFHTWHRVDSALIVVLSITLPLWNANYWQRILSAKDIKVAKKWFVYSLIPIFLVVLALTFIWVLIGSDFVVETWMAWTLPHYSSFLVITCLIWVISMIMSSVDWLIITGSTIVWDVLWKDINKVKFIYIKLMTLAFGILGLLITLLNLSIFKSSIIWSAIYILFAVLSIIAYVKYRKEKKITST